MIDERSEERGWATFYAERETTERLKPLLDIAHRVLDWSPTVMDEANDVEVALHHYFKTGDDRA